MGCAVLRILLQQVFEDLARRGGVAFEEVLLLAPEVCGTLPPRAQRGVEGDVAEQIEGVSVRLAGHRAQLVEADAALFEQLDHQRAGLRIGPLLAQRRQRGVERAHLFAGIVGVLHDPQLLAVRVQLVDQVGDDLHHTAVEVELARRCRWRWVGHVVPLQFADVPALATVAHRLLQHRGGSDHALPIDHVLYHRRGVAVECGVGEECAGGAGIVDDVEVQLPVVVAQPGAAADDLLELHHRADHPRKHHVLAGGRAHAGGEQLRGGQDHRTERLDVLKAAQVAAPGISLVRGYPAHVVGELPHQVGVQVGERLPHLQRMLLIDAEDDRLGEAIGVFHEVAEVPGDRFGALSQRHHPLEVFGAVLIVRDRAPEAIQVARARSPARGIVGADHPMDAIGGQEPVVDALAQAVLVDGLAEVGVAVPTLVAHRGRGHAELIGRFEVLQDLAPGAVRAGAAAMALIDDDQVEEVARIGAVEARTPLVLGDGLVGCEIHLAPHVGDAMLDLPARVTEWPEGFLLRVVDQDRAIGQEEDLGSPARSCAAPPGVPELPADLEGDHRLAGARGHRQQQAIRALGDRLHGAVDRDLLIVARDPPDLVVRRRDQLCGGAVVQILGGAQALPQLVRRGEGLQLAFLAGQVVELHDAGPVGGVGELEAEDAGVVLALLQPVAGQLVLGLGLDHRQRQVPRVAQQVIRPLTRTAVRLAPRKHDTPIGEGVLLGNGVGLRIPARRAQPRDHVRPAGVGLVHHAHPLQTIAQSA